MTTTSLTPVRWHWLLLATGALAFAALTGLGARIKLEIGPVPFTLQTLFVVLAGLVLGARAGAASQMVYVGAISAGLPLDAGPYGSAVWGRPSAGYLLGFVLGAFVTGWLRERWVTGQTSALSGFWRCIGAGLAGGAAVYAIGMPWLTLLFLGGDWRQGWGLGVIPFALVDAAKATLAAALFIGGQRARRFATGGL